MRTELPKRRQNDIRQIEFGGTTFTVCVGYDEAGQPKEVFADGHRTGAAVGAMLADACTIISVALQNGIPPDALGKSLGREPRFVLGVKTDGPASPIGDIIAELRPRPEIARRGA